MIRAVLLARDSGPRRIRPARARRRRLGLAPKDAAGKQWTHQLQLTIADFVVEIHDTHHPIGSGLYYKDQKREAKRRSRDFPENRLRKLHDTVFARPRIARYVASGRRLPFNNNDIFRHYRELDTR